MSALRAMEILWGGYSIIPRFTGTVFLTVLMMMVGTPGIVVAAYGGNPQSHVDPQIMKVDEEKYLGVSVNKGYVLRDADGNEFTIGDMLGTPLVLVLSYFSCDGSCPTINRALRRTIDGVKRWKLGKDYRVLTASFDPNDGPAQLQMFMEHTGFKQSSNQGWAMATLKNPEDIVKLAGSVGFKYFWEPRDRVFLHPSVYMMVSPQGRVTRFLYGDAIEPWDMEVSITKAYGSELSASNVINFMLGACFSYNFEDGKYVLNIPIFIALGALGLGITSLIGGSVIMRRRVKV